MHPDFRLVPAASLAWAAAVAGTRWPPPIAAGLSVVLVIGAVAVTLSVRRHADLKATAGLPVLAAGVVLGSAAAHLAVESRGPLAELAQQRRTVVMRAMVLSDPQPVASRGPARYRVQVRVRDVRAVWEERAQPASGRVTAFVNGSAAVDESVAPSQPDPAGTSALPAGSPGLAMAPGSTVQLRGRLSATTPGQRDRAIISVTSAPDALAPPGPVYSATDRLRAGLRLACDTLPADQRGLLPALVVGDTSAMPADLREDMRRTGLAHLSAVSGANTTLVCGAALWLVRALGASRRMQVAAAGAALLGFILLAGPEPSVVRAGVMGSVALLGLVWGRRGQAIAALSATVIGLCVADPYLGGEIGFVLSVTATAGIVLLAASWARAMGTVLPYPVALAVAVPAAAQAVVGPVLLALRPEVPLLGVAANIMAAPAVAPATVLGVLVTAVAALSSPAAQGVAMVAGWPVGWIAAVARYGSQLPMAVLPWPDGPGGTAALIALTVAVVGLLAAMLRRIRLRRRSPRALRPEPFWPISRPAIPRRLGFGYRWAAVALVGIVIVAAGARHISAGRAFDGWLVAACPVGQGDAMVIRTGPGSAIVSDVGPDPSSMRRCLDRLAVDRIDLVALSHFHLDHVGGLPGALRGRSVGELLVSPLAEPAANAKVVRAQVAEAGVRSAPGEAGMTGSAAAVTWEVLWPASTAGAAERGTGGTGESAPNNASLVLLVQTAGVRILLLGDLEPTAQRALAALWRESGQAPVDVVKVAHHGSKHQHEPLYTLVAPRAAIITVGEHNDYGHPAGSVVRDLADAGAAVVRTDTDGMVLIGRGAEAPNADLWIRTLR